MASRDALTYRFGPFELRPTDQLLLQDGNPVHLQKKTFDVLVALVERSGRLVTHHELKTAAWPEGEPTDGRLSHTVWLLRRLFGDLTYIETVSKQGYRFSGPVSDASAARRHYAEGRHYWAQRTPGSLAQAIELFHAAIDAEPGFAPAYAGLADSYNLLGHWGVASPKESFPMAKAAAARALALDPKLAEAHASYGLACRNFDWNFEEAGRSLRLAMQLDPAYATARQWNGDLLTTLGLLEEGLQNLEQAKALDPLSPIIEARIALQHYFMRDYAKAIERIEGARRLGPVPPAAQAVLGAAYERMGSYPEALAVLEKGRSPDNPLALSLLGHANAVAGRRKEALAMLEELETASRQTYVSPFHEARIYAGLEDEERTRRALERTVEERSDFALWLRIDPALDPWRSAAWFEPLTRTVGLP